MKSLISAAAALGFTALTAACVVVPPPKVVAFNGDSVEIHTVPTVPFPGAPTQAEADRICSKAGKRAEYASSRQVADGHLHLYLCLD